MYKSPFIAFFFLCSILSTAYPQTGKQTMIFDGKTLNGWKKLGGSADYKVENGVIVGTTVSNSKNTFLVTEKEYSDFIIELDIKVEDASMNSGVQTRSHYDAKKESVYGRQVEVDPSGRSWSGGIYDEGRRDWLYPLDLNPKAKTAYKTGNYNHYRIECIGNETKTWLNNIPIAYVVDTIDSKGFIGLQVHGVPKGAQAGKKVYFKDIRFQTSNLKPQSFDKGIYVVNYSPNSLTASEKQSGWKLLFDGKTSKGWRSATGSRFPEKGWKIIDGTFRVDANEGGESTNGGDIVTDGMYSAFDLSFEFKLTPGANSGVKYFVTLSEATKGSAIGLEYQVLDDALHPDAKLGKDGNRTLSSLYDMIKAEKNPRFARAIGNWNNGRVIVYPNNHVEHYLNGVKVLEYERGSQAFRDLVAGSKYKIWKNFGEAPAGRILLQDHGNEVSFRSIKIKSIQ